MDLAPIAFAGSPFATLVIDPVGDRILAANDAARRLLGYSGNEPAGLCASGLYPGQRPALIVFSQAVLERGADWTPRLSPPATSTGARSNSTPTGCALPCLPAAPASS